MKYILAGIALTFAFILMSSVFLLGGVAMLLQFFKDRYKFKILRRKLYHKTRRKFLYFNTKYRNLNYDIPEDKEFFIWD